MTDPVTKTWFRNPDDYIRELVETGETRIAWDRGRLIKLRIEPSTFAELYFGGGVLWEALVVGSQGAVHIDNDHSMKSPKAVYPVWSYGMDFGELEEMMQSNVGDDADACSDPDTPVDERPVFGQDHIIVINEIPNTTTGPGRRFITQLKEMHEDYPDVVIHIHGLYSFRVMFGMGFGSADVDPRTEAKGGHIVIPPGKKVKPDNLVSNPQWSRILGFNPVDLQIPRNRCLFNIKSATWAAQYWHTDIAPKTQGHYNADLTTPTGVYYPPSAGKHIIRSRVGNPGDKIACNDCSLAIDCKWFRTDSVCTVPKTETAGIAKFFGTRDSDTIIEGLSELVKKNAERLDKGLAMEDTLGDLSPEVTKGMSQVFDQGVKLAKLIDPSLRAGPRVQVNVGAGGAAAVSVTQEGPRKLITQAMRELEAQGFKREEITSDMVDTILRRMLPQDSRPPIEGTIIREEDR